MQLLDVPGTVEHEFLGHDSFVLIFIPIVPWVEFDLPFQRITLYATICAKVVQPNFLNAGQ